MTLKALCTRTLLCLAFFCQYACANDSPAEKPDKDTYVHYTLSFDIDSKLALMRIQIHNAKKIKRIQFNIENSTCSGFSSPAFFHESNHNLLIWEPAKNITLNNQSAELHYVCDINNKKSSKHSKAAFDAFITDHWSLFRGDDLVPPTKIRRIKGTNIHTRLEVELPKQWASFNTEWPKDFSSESKHPVFIIDNPARMFPRPTGWMIAGNLGTRRARLNSSQHNTYVSVSAPKGSSFRRMDVLTFVQFIWPELINVCKTAPKKVLIVGADSPMWRGGLSAGNSLFLHAERPLVSENGTSTLIHELFHMCSGIRGQEQTDWIAEGLAEFYSLEILYRSGGLDKKRYELSIEQLRQWSEGETQLNKQKSTAATTAKATVLFWQLNQEILKKSDGSHSLDDVVAQLLAIKKVSVDDLVKAVELILGAPSTTLKHAPI